MTSLKSIHVEQEFRPASPAGSNTTALGVTPADVASGIADSQLPIDQMEMIGELALSSVLPLEGTYARALAYCQGASTLAIGAFKFRRL